MPQYSELLRPARHSRWFGTYGDESHPPLLRHKIVCYPGSDGRDGYSAPGPVDRKQGSDAVEPDGEDLEGDEDEGELREGGLDIGTLEGAVAGIVWMPLTGVKEREPFATPESISLCAGGLMNPTVPESYSNELVKYNSD
ncbi:unnamed protein product [Penicillium bialowiezense]